MHILSPTLPICFDPETLTARIKKRVSPGELFGILLGLALLGVFIWYGLTAPGQVSPHDFSNYLDAGRGNYHEYYYGFWIVPVLSLLARLPFAASYFIWGAANILGIYFAARIFSGKAVFALLTYQFFCVIYVGQITGLIAGGLALFWWAASQKKWYLAGLGLLIAVTKFQIGLVFGGLLFLIAPIALRDRIKILAVPVIGMLLSFLLYPGWPMTILATMRSSPPNDWSSISLWTWFGPYALLLYATALLMPGAIRDRAVALMILTPLAFPYFQEYDLLILFALPFGPWALLGNLGFLYAWYSWDALKLMTVVPIVFYIVWAWPGLRVSATELKKRFTTMRG